MVSNIKTIRDKEIIVFSDFDGTLFQNNPNKFNDILFGKISDQILGKISHGITFSVVTSRPYEEVSRIFCNLLKKNNSFSIFTDDGSSICSASINGGKKSDIKHKKLPAFLKKRIIESAAESFSEFNFGRQNRKAIFKSDCKRKNAIYISIDNIHSITETEHKELFDLVDENVTNKLGGLITMFSKERGSEFSIKSFYKSKSISNSKHLKKAGITINQNSIVCYLGDEANDEECYKEIYKLRKQNIHSVSYKVNNYSDHVSNIPNSFLDKTFSDFYLMGGANQHLINWNDVESKLLDHYEIIGLLVEAHLYRPGHLPILILDTDSLCDILVQDIDSINSVAESVLGVWNKGQIILHTPHDHIYDKVKKSKILLNKNISVVNSRNNKFCNYKFERSFREKNNSLGINARFPGTFQRISSILEIQDLCGLKS